MISHDSLHGIITLFSTPVQKEHIGIDWKLSTSIEGKVSRCAFLEVGDKTYTIKCAQKGQEDFFREDLERHQWLSQKIDEIPKILISEVQSITPFCLQEYISGVPVNDFTGTLQWRSLVENLIKIHTIRPSSNSWGYPSLENRSEGKLSSFADLVQKKEIEPIMNTVHLNSNEKDELVDCVTSYKKYYSDGGARSCLVHGDCHEGNMIVDEKGIITLIDFGNVIYLTPEHDIARIKTQKYFQDNPDTVTQIISIYESNSGKKLNQNLINFFLTTRLAYQIRKPISEERTQKSWKMLRDIQAQF
ncbi:aminoglycoside phosphotransferase family protein [Candidatus Gracilibacteria bacterium]|nr:aminoglycoside phosphotransferase family protein [Candidatus Gracilibacteria bacterium]